MSPSNVSSNDTSSGFVISPYSPFPQAPSRNDDNSGAPPNHSSAISSPGLHYLSPYTIFLLVAILVLVLSRIIQIYSVRRRDRRRGNENVNHQTAMDALTNNTIAMVKMDLKDRIGLYQKTFDNNQHQRILTAENFRNDGKNDGVDDDFDQSCYDEEEQQPYIYLDVTNSCDTAVCGGVDSSSNDHNDSSGNNDNDNSSVSIPFANDSNDSISKDDTISNEQEHQIKEQQQQQPSKKAVPGTCIICLEDFSIGDTVVWSDDNHSARTTLSPQTHHPAASVTSNNTGGCPHVFHKDCLCQFLASHSQRTKQPQQNNNNNEHCYSQNPCPVCRQKFCTVSNEDILLAILLKSFRAALVSSSATTTGLPEEQRPAAANTNNRSGNDDTDPNDANTGSVNANNNTIDDNTVVQEEEQQPEQDNPEMNNATSRTNESSTPGSVEEQVSSSS